MNNSRIRKVNTYISEYVDWPNDYFYILEYEAIQGLIMTLMRLEIL